MEVFIILCVFAVAIVFVVFLVKKQKEAKQASAEAVETKMQETGFQISKKVPLLDGIELFIDDTNKKWLIKRSAVDSNPTIYSYSDLIEFEITQNGGSIAKGVTKGKVSGHTGRAVVGGILFGPIGAVAGAAGKRKISSTTTTITSETCTSLQVRIRVADLGSPEIVIPFIKSEVKTDSFIYKSCISLAKNLAATLAYVQSGKSEAELEKEAVQGISTPDELQKFYNLKEAGVITEEEFEAKKKQLLGL